MHSKSLRSVLLGGCGALSLLAGTHAAAQAPTDPARADQGVLGEVVVTATRQSETVNRVPLSVTAVTSASIDQQHLKNVEDISRTVPAIQFRTFNLDNASTIAIRGIYSQFGAPTTGVYLDDTPISKRALTGETAGNGAPYPQLFDLERVEVLRGPQGTLFGAGSEGGTVRFISPDPSLTTMSGKVRASASETYDGGPSYDAGFALGGPIIQDKLGFRGSVQAGHYGGYIDHVSPYDGHTFGTNTNWRDTRAMRLALALAPNDRIRITPSVVASRDYYNDSDSWISNIPQYTLNAGYFINSGTGRNGVPFSYPTTYFPGGTYGPYNMYGPYKTLTGLYGDEQHNAQLLTSPTTKTLFLPALKIEADAGLFNVTSITSLVQDHTSQQTQGVLKGTYGQAAPNSTYNTNVGCFSSSPTTCIPVPGGMVGVGNRSPVFYPGFPQFYWRYDVDNKRSQFTQEVRFATPKDARPLQLQAGVFYLNSRIDIVRTTEYNEGAMSEYYRGFNVMPYYFGLTDLSPTGGGACFSIKHQTLCHITNVSDVSALNTYNFGFSAFYETEQAAFGEASFFITEKLKATAGVRLSRIWIKSYQNTYGSSVNSSQAIANGFKPTAAHPFPILPGDPDYSRPTYGTGVEKPINPHFGLSYQATDDDLFYLTASKGYRAGGVNGQVQLRADCQAQLLSFGLSSVPVAFQSDSVWNYEGGAKVRLFGGRAQVNASLFYLDWKNPQLTIVVPCGTSFITNAGHAVSKGVDFESEFRVTPNLTASFSGVYDDAEYVEDTVATDPTTGTKSYTVHKGDTLPAPKVQFMVGLNYDFAQWNGWNAYARGDYQYNGPYKRTNGPGSAGYDPDAYNAISTSYTTATLGARRGATEVSLYVKNLFNFDGPVYQFRGNINTENNFTFRPREIGVQVTHSF